MTKRTLVICATHTEAARLFDAMVRAQVGNKGYKNRLEAVTPVGDTVESHLFRSLRQLNDLDGMRFDEVSITDNAYKNGNLGSLTKAIYLKGMLTAHIPREEPL